MTGFWVLLLLLLISALPPLGVFIWFRIIRFPIPIRGFIYALIGGSLAFLLAGILQSFFPPLNDRAWGIPGLGLFVQIALTEEGSKFIILLILMGLAGKAAPPAQNLPPKVTAINPEPAVMGAALGLLVGLGFALIENTTYGASDFRLTFIRALTASPLHGACGSRAGIAAFSLRRRPALALIRLFSGVALHGMYNLMLMTPGLPVFFPLLLTAAALISSVTVIIRGLEKP